MNISGNAYDSLNESYSILKDLVAAINHRNGILDGSLNDLAEEFNARLDYVGVPRIQVVVSDNFETAEDDLIYMLRGEGYKSEVAIDMLERLGYRGITASELRTSEGYYRASYNRDTDKIAIWSYGGELVGIQDNPLSGLQHTYVTQRTIGLLLELLVNTGLELNQVGIGGE